MEFTVQVENGELAAALGSINAWDGKTRLAVEAALKKGTDRILRQARQRAAVRTGAMKKSLKQSFSATKLEGRVYSNKPYAHLVEYGAKAASVRPKRKKALRFSNGDFSMKANIPRRDPKPFMKPAYDYCAPDIIKEIKKAVGKK